MLATVPSATLVGVRGQSVQVEVHVGQGLPTFTLVGLPDASCREARDRVPAAFASSGLKFPSTHRVTVNLAPTDVPKTGAVAAQKIGALQRQGVHGARRADADAPPPGPAAILDRSLAVVVEDLNHGRILAIRKRTMSPGSSSAGVSAA